MNQVSKNEIVQWFSLPLAAIVIFVSVTGLATPGVYAAETPNWQAQSYGQDLADLFLVTPALIISSINAYQGRKSALFIWAGVVLYLLYTFLIYCFAIHFNKLFVFYCLALGLSFYSLLWFFYSLLKRKVKSEDFRNIPHRLIGIYFIIVSCLFYFLWLSEIIPAIMNGDIPESIKETGLLTNAVHVIDLSVFLPGIFIAGILILQRKIVGYYIAPVFLSFFILMDITIGGLVVLMKLRALGGSYAVSILMAILALVSTILLTWYFKSLKSLKQ